MNYLTNLAKAVTYIILVTLYALLCLLAAIILIVMFPFWVLPYIIIAMMDYQTGADIMIPEGLNMFYILENIYYWSISPT